MSNAGTLKQGQKIDAIFAPEDSEGCQIGGAVGYDSVTDIEIGQCAGPMGWYDVAIIRREHQEDQILPVHMADYIRLKSN